MIDPKHVTAVVVTKGDHELRELDYLYRVFPNVLIWNNLTAEGGDRRVYGRYLAAAQAATEFVFTTDDDCLVSAVGLCEEYRPGELLCNMTKAHREFYAPTGLALVGWGSIFPKAMIDFSAYLAKYPADELFDRECDRVFTWLNRGKTRVVDFGVKHLPQALGMDRMGTESRHGADLAEIRRRLATL